MKETEERFHVHSKQLSKLLSGKRYLGGKDRKIVPKRMRKSLSLSTAVKGPDDTSSDLDVMMIEQRLSRKIFSTSSKNVLHSPSR